MLAGSPFFPSYFVGSGVFSHETLAVGWAEAALALLVSALAVLSWTVPTCLSHCDAYSPNMATACQIVAAALTVEFTLRLISDGQVSVGSFRKCRVYLIPVT